MSDRDEARLCWRRVDPAGSRLVMKQAKSVVETHGSSGAYLANAMLSKHCVSAELQKMS
jgi:hypothetical protein